MEARESEAFIKNVFNLKRKLYSRKIFIMNSNKSERRKVNGYYQINHNFL